MMSIRYIAFALVVAAFGWMAPGGSTGTADAQVADYAAVEYEDGNGAVTYDPDMSGDVAVEEIDETTYDEKTILSEGADFFGEGAEGLGTIIEKIFVDLGRPNGYIKGSEGSAAIVVGLRYGKSRSTNIANNA